MTLSVLSSCNAWKKEVNNYCLLYTPYPAKMIEDYKKASKELQLWIANNEEIYFYRCD